MRLEPRDGTQEDLRFGLLASLVANALRGKDGRIFNPWDFFPSIDRPTRRRQSVKDMIEMAKNLTVAMGGKVTPHG